MSVGDVDVTIVDSPTAANLDTAVTALRTSADDHYLLIPLQNGTKVACMNMEEA